MKLATVEKIIGIFPHPNADKLEFVKVLGYMCITAKGAYTAGEQVILIQPDTVLPDAPWTELYKKFSRSRVKAMKLRDAWSFGIVEKMTLLPAGRTFAEGEEVSELLGIVKYEAPVPNDIAFIGALPFGIPKTDEERYQNLPLNEWMGQKVDVTLKVDGQSFTAYFKDGAFGVCGRQFELDMNVRNPYTEQITRYNLPEKLEAFCKKHGVNIAIRGESYGTGIQGSKINPHSAMNKGLAVFSVFLIDEHRYARKGDPFYFVNVCAEMDLPTVNVLENDAVLTPELIKYYDEDIREINGKSFEGVVINGAGFSFKIINKYYDSEK
jgi:RNA ligase (TIGR02306 family)